MRIAGLHIVEGCIEAGVHGEIELLGSVIGQGDAGGGSLCVVDENVDAAELLDGLVDDVLDDSCVVCASVHVSSDDEDFNAVLALELLLGGLELLHVAAGDDQVAAFLSVCGCDAETDGASGAVLQSSEASAGDDSGFTLQKTHDQPPCAINPTPEGLYVSYSVTL